MEYVLTQPAESLDIPKECFAYEIEGPLFFGELIKHWMFEKKKGAFVL